MKPEFKGFEANSLGQTGKVVITPKGEGLLIEVVDNHYLKRKPGTCIMAPVSGDLHLPSLKRDFERALEDLSRAFKEEDLDELDEYEATVQATCMYCRTWTTPEAWLAGWEGDFDVKESVEAYGSIDALMQSIAENDHVAFDEDAFRTFLESRGCLTC